MYWRGGLGISSQAGGGEPCIGLRWPRDQQSGWRRGTMYWPQVA